jgi:hypothetical protein
LKEIDDILNKAADSRTTYQLQGYSGEEIESIFFSMYQSLGGEIESRDVQHTSALDQELKGYSLPLSSEYVEEKKITNIFKEMFLSVPQNIEGGVENIGNGKYIIHLFDSSTPEPILHELGHILYDLLKDYHRTTFDLFDIHFPDSDMIGGRSEIFCELFLSYLSKQDINPRFNRSIAERKLLKHTFMDEIFDSIFKHKQDYDEKLIGMLSYLKKLNDSHLIGK